MGEIIKNRIQLLRDDMQKNKIDAVIIPSGDVHQSEYIAAYWAVRAWLSGFSGSSGTLVILPDYAALWTDSRYFLQAEKELDGTGITLHKQTIPHAPEHVPWLSKILPAGKCVGLDCRLFSISQMTYITAQLSAQQIIISDHYEPFNQIWQNRPALPTNPVFEHETIYCSFSRTEKINILRDKLSAHCADYLILSSLDDIAWILNLRGNDIPYNPLFYAFLIIAKDSCLFYINEKKIPFNLKRQLSDEKITLLPYDDFLESITRLSNQKTFIIHPESINAAIFKHIPSEKIIFQPNWTQDLKAIKSEKEIKHFQNAMQKDGIALIRAFRWLERCIKEGEIISEFDFAEKCAFFRSHQPNYMGESFHSIVSYNQNGAIIHYHPDSENAAIIKSGGLLLIDSGGQYLDGTTDITRTIFIGENPPSKIKFHFTLVLKSFISLASTHFPAGTVGMQLDAMARKPLWKHGLDYAHGTGHGVGFYLSVHEGPQGFATNPTTSRGTTAFRPGMVTTNEPGLYLEGEYGIRIENILLCKEINNGFLAFENLTLFPVSISLIEGSLLNQGEKDWLNNYHRLVWDRLSPFISEDEKIWLKQQCSPI